MARLRASYVCQNCGAISQRWQGKCDACGEWNTLVEEAVREAGAGRGARGGGRRVDFADLSGSPEVASAHRSMSKAFPTSSRSSLRQRELKTSPSTTSPWV